MLKLLLQNCLQTLESFNLDGFTGKFIIKDPTSCPNCGSSGCGIAEIVKKFGLRNMGDGTVRVQSWCKECRRLPTKLYR